MTRLHIPQFLLATLFIGSWAQISAATQSISAEPETSIGWFERARDQMNLRMPSSAPFHMKVKFRAFPGMELLGAKEKPEIITGDGVYEETWLAPHKWRREVTLADYHALEVESELGRKMRPSSDYEPSRVLMLLNALLYPIPRNFASREFRHQGASGWQIDHVSNGSLSLIRISRGVGDERGDLTDAFYFQPHGLLALRNDEGFITSWEQFILFAGKAVPKHLSIKAGERDLLTADVIVEAAGQVASGEFDMPGGTAEPGMTMRPFLDVEVRRPDLTFSHGWTKDGRSSPSRAFSLREVLDRHGRYREVELILVLNPEDAHIIMTFMREERHHPAEIDGSPCQLAVSWAFL